METKKNKLATQVLTILIGSISYGFAEDPVCTTLANGQINCQAGTWTPQKNSNDVGQKDNFNGAVAVTGGNTVNYFGPVSGVSGDRGMPINQTLGDILGSDSLYFDETKLSLGAPVNVTIVHPINGTRVISVYDSNNFALNQALNPNEKIYTYYGVDTDEGRGMYINTVFATVDSNQGGGVLNIEDLKFTNLYVAKQTNGLFRVIGSNDEGAADAILNWNADGNYNFVWPQTTTPNNPGQTTNSQKFNYTEFNDTPITIDGKQFVVTDIASLQNYNNQLIQSINNGGEVTEDNYQTYINKVYDSNVQTYEIPNENNIQPGDSLTLNTGGMAVITATGKSAEVNIMEGKKLSLAVPTWWGSLILASSGVKVTNNGLIGVQLASAVHLTKSEFINSTTGVVFAGTWQFSNIENAKLDLWSGGGYGIVLNNGSKATNLGIINVVGTANSISAGTIMNGNAEFINESSGVINVGGTNLGAWTGPNRGFQLANNNNTVINNGQIKVGYGSQYTLDTASVEVSNKNRTGSVGIYDVGNNSIITNNGTIVLGSYIDNSYGIQISGANQSQQRQVTNAKDGIITINSGFNKDNPLFNPYVSYGLYIKDNNDQTENNFVNNMGVINVAGVNGIGMYITANNLNASGESSGTINVTGNSGYDKNGFIQNRNYGFIVDKTSTSITQNSFGTVSGEINVLGDGAVGIYARKGGVVNLTDSSKLNLSTGHNQIGIVLENPNSHVNLASKDFKVGSDDSIGFYIFNGASFTSENTSGDALNFELAGNGSKGIIAAGIDTSINTDNTIFNMNAANSLALQVRSGATGTISKDTTLNLNADGSVGGSVDGTNYDLFDRYLDKNGDVVSDISLAYKDSNTTLISGATINSNKGNTVGYNVINSGTLKLTNDSSINLEGVNTIGVIIDGANLSDTDGPNIMFNDGYISSNSIGIKASGGKTVVNNTGKIIATDGIAAILIEQGASLTLGDGTESSVTGEIIAKGSADGILIYGDSTDSSKNSTLAKKNSGSIKVEGTGAGLHFTNSDGSVRLDDFDISESQGLTIDVTGANGHGIIANTSGVVSSGANVNINSAQGSSALEITGGATKVYNSGNLISVSTNSSVISNAGTVNYFNNTGLIKAVDDSHNAINLTVAGSTFINDDQSVSGGTAGIINGVVNIAGNESYVDLNGNSQVASVIATGSKNNFTLNDVTAENNKIFGNITGGSDEQNTLNLNNSAYIYNDLSGINNFNQLNLTNNSEFTLKQAITLGTENNIAIDQNSSLKIMPSTQGDFNLANNLTGNGKVSVDNGGEFNLTGDSHTFSGRIEFNNASFNLDGKNTTNVVNATLVANEKSLIEVGSGDQNIGGLAFSGGAVSFNVTPTNAKADTFIKANALDISGNGQVALNVNPYENEITPNINSSLSLLEQDDMNLITQLASGNTVLGSGGNLILVDDKGNKVSDGTVADILQNNEKVAEGTYDYRLTGQNDKDAGLYVNYGLTELNLIGKGDDALVLIKKENSVGNASDMSAKLTGSGDLNINAGTGSISLSNSSNNYTGSTNIKNGTLRLDTDEALGNTNLLTLANDTAFQLNGHQQIILGNLEANASSSIDLSSVTGTASGKNGVLTVDGTTNLNAANIFIGDNNTFNAKGLLSVDESSKINLANGTMNIGTGGISNGELLGSGLLNFNGGTFNIQNANVQLSADININEATLDIGNVKSLGNSNVYLKNGVNSNLTINNSKGDFTNNISGDGRVTITDNTNIILSGENKEFTGIIDIQAGKAIVNKQDNIGNSTISLVNNGTFEIDTSSDWTLANKVSGSGIFNKSGIGTLTINDHNISVDQTNINDGMLTVGNNFDNSSSAILSSKNINITKDGSLGGYGTVIGNVTNSGVILPGSDYKGNRSNSSPFGIFTIDGNYMGESGSKIVFNTALGGDNSQTSKLIIKGNSSGTSGVVVNNIGGVGAQTIEGIEIITVNGNSDAVFTKEGRIVAGAYDYNLVKNDKNWYLTSSSNESIKPTNPSQPISSRVPTYRPEAGSYATNLMASNTLFITSLQNRNDAIQSSSNGETGVSNNVWVRTVGGHERSKMTDKQNKTSADYYVLQMGGDILNVNNNGLNEYHVGLFGGVANYDSKTRSSVSGYSSKGEAMGYSLGVYGTWYQNTMDENSLYVDTWLLYNYFKNNVRGDLQAKEKYHADGLTASIETGYSFNIGNSTSANGTQTSYWLQPKAQLIYMGVKSDSLRELNGTRVSDDGSDNIQTKLSLKAYLQNGEKSSNEFMRFYTEFGWIHNTQSYGVRMDDVVSRIDGARNIGEAILGVEMQLKSNLQLWGNIGHQVGKKGYQNTRGLVGLKYTF